MTAIYLDNAASTRPAPEVLSLVAEVAAQHYANPSSAHTAGAAAARLLEGARREVAAALRAAPDEIVFTGGGTEANALGIAGATGRARGRHLVVSAIEHASVLRTAERLASAQPGGFELTVVPVGPRGVADAAAVAAAVRPDTAVVAIMLVNNELGTVQPVGEISQAIARAAGGAPPGRRPHLHVDAVQALGFFPVRPATLGADSLALSGHKVHGPKGTGALWVRAGARLGPLWGGGGQERGLRPGTENLPAIAGFARAVTMAVEAAASGAGERVAVLRDGFEENARAAGAHRTVSGVPRAPHISSLRLPGLPAEPLLHALDARGVIVSAGSACASKSRGPSHVLKAIGVGDDDAVLRFSLSRETTRDQLDAAAAALAAAVFEIKGAVH